MNVYRITREKYQHDLMGTGARLYGGRWNPVGVSLLYTAESRALAAMEFSVRMDITAMPDNLVIQQISLSLGRGKELLKELGEGELPSAWNKYPERTTTQHIGKQFAGLGNYLALKVPSVAISHSYHFLVNTQHPVFRKNVRLVSTQEFVIGR